MAEAVKYEKFEYDNIKTKLISLKENYTNYINAVNKIDLILTTELNNSRESAMFNPQGENIVSLWNNYGSKLKGFLYIFEKWTDSIATVYNNNLQFEEGNPDNMVLDDVDLNIKPTTYSTEDLNRDNINYSTGYESEINKKYQDYLDGKISETEWNKYVAGLNTEQQNYAKILATGGLVVNAEDVESILQDTFESPKNMAETIAEMNKVPEGWTYVDLYGFDRMVEDTYEDPFNVRMDSASSFSVWANSVDPSDESRNIFPVVLNYNKEFDKETDTYIKAVEGETGTEFELYRNGKFVRRLDSVGHFMGGSHEAEFAEVWDETYPNICRRTYSDEGYQAYKKFKNSINDNYEEFKNTNKFYLSEDRSVYFSGEDGEIHYSDGSILQIYEDDLKWDLNIFFLHFEGKDNSTIQDIFMIANGYIAYELDWRCKGYGEW